jgi:serine/threonine-protein kinase RsbW
VPISIEINVALSLPRDELTVPIVRHICGYALREVGALKESVDDIELALTEACTNVLDHSAADDEYEVQISIRDTVCIIRVRDAGRGFDFSTLTDGVAELSAEGGRGIGLMNALVDKVKFTSRPEIGMIVHLEKELQFDEDSAIRRRAVRR